MQGKWVKFECNLTAIGAKGSKFRETLRQIFVENKIYFSKPSKLNDPHDCRPTTKKLSAKELRKMVQTMGNRVIKRRNLSLSEKEKRSKDTEAVIKLSDPMELNDRLFQLIDDAGGVFCASATAKSSTQWAYYADSHKGICIEFTVQNTSPIAAVAVNYSDERPIIDVSKLYKDERYRDEQIAIATTTKSKSWEQEEEVQFMYSKCGLVNFDGAMLTKVIFGLNTPAPDENFIRDLLDEACITPKLMRCRIDATSYELHIDQASGKRR